jgi:FAD/FMN-containing dehydrogenase
MSDETVNSWGHYPAYPQTAHACYWRNEIPATLSSLAKNHINTLPFGMGRSYGDSCLASSNHVLQMSTLNRFISADWEQGIIIAEAGLTIAELLNVIIPHGWFIPVTPGTKYVTLGGALANDVHGKNHHKRGTFGQYVPRFSLIRSDRPALICSAEENSNLYKATIGGLGLTGIIEWVELKLIPIQSSQIDTTHIRFNSLADFFTLSAELDNQYEYAVAWIDCLAKGSALGRGIYTVGNHADNGVLTIDNKSKITVPFAPPISLVNNLSLRLFNSLYYHAPTKNRQNKQMSYEPFFYPLDRILHWNRLYGSRGFQQYQCVIPEEIAEITIHALLTTIAAAGKGSFLAVLKKCGSIISPGLLSFPLPGVSLALDFPQDDILNKRLFPHLDAIIRQANGRLYPAKDAHMSGEDFRQFYPAWQQVEALRDPALYSHFWRRVIT